MTESTTLNNFQSDFFDGIVLTPAVPPPPLSFDFIHEERLGRAAIVVRNLLSQEECNEMITFIDAHEHTPSSSSSLTGEEQEKEQSKEQPRMTAASASPSHRNNQRLCISSPTLSSALLHRLRPVLTSLDEHEITCTADNAHKFLNKGFGMEGVWQIDSLNSCFRLCKYHPGGHFGPHYDSDFVVDPMQQRSLKTFMVYLNDSYEGGETNFVESHDLHFDKDRQIYCAPPESVFAGLKARRGDCLVFDHLLLHEGQQVTQGQKYIIRSDLMYKKQEDEGEGEGGNDNTRRCRQREALTLFLAGAALEEEGHVDAAVQKYSRAFKICPEIEDAYA